MPDKLIVQLSANFTDDFFNAISPESVQKIKKIKTKSSLFSHPKPPFQWLLVNVYVALNLYRKLKLVIPYQTFAALRLNIRYKQLILKLITQLHYLY